MPVGKRIVDLRNICCPVLNIMAGKDDLVPSAQSAPFNDRSVPRTGTRFFYQAAGTSDWPLADERRKKSGQRRATGWAKDRTNGDSLTRGGEQVLPKMKDQHDSRQRQAACVARTAVVAATRQPLGVSWGWRRGPSAGREACATRG
jgi:hypothetical protein